MPLWVFIRKEFNFIEDRSTPFFRTGNFITAKYLVMKCYCLYFTCFLLISISSTAQSQTTKTNTSSASKTTQSTGPSGNQSLAIKTDSLKMAMSDLKTSFNSIFGNKRDTISIYISNIEYDDNNLAILKDDLKKVKGVKAVNMQYRQSVALLDISFKGKSADLWDKLPTE